ncbi:hypothetical protein SAMN02745163_02796 [Clostridium cavendishii DSM 21758]|uniref:Uncharacterized protein n=1 Tax=Clostridium cavendishii DSM 21758 TaxID=1121302 RepID=A0A1M6MX91_9CLOT|nr:hypothetical protein [Clostridium cavendishii]SHJ88059.1 hypothetical protein SAMN02745163_02796 [Clostridium cavendishii DSM 21758]
MDNFKEQLVRIEDIVIYNIAYGISIVLFVLSLISLIFVGISVAVILAILAGALFYFKRFLYCEYEYIITNGEVDIDCIYQVNSRKSKLSFEVKDTSLIAAKDSEDYKGFSNKPKDIINCIPKGNKDKVYVAILNEGSNKKQIEFVPNKEFLDICFLYNPKVVKR